MKKRKKALAYAKRFDRLVNESIDEAFSSLGEPKKTVTYRYLQEKFSINRLGGPNHIEDFSDVLDHKNNTFKDEVHSRSIAIKLEYISESTTINKLRLMITTYVTWG